MEEAQASQLIPVNRSISLPLLLHQTLFPPSHHSPDQTSMIKFLPRVSQEGAGVAIAIANHPWFGRQAKPGRSSQVKAGGRRACEAVCTQAHPGSQIALPALSPGRTHPSAKSVCKRRILQCTMCILSSTMALWSKWPCISYRAILCSPCSRHRAIIMPL